MCDISIPLPVSVLTLDYHANYRLFTQPYQNSRQSTKSQICFTNNKHKQALNETDTSKPTGVPHTSFKVFSRGVWSLFPTFFLEFWKLLRTRGAMWQCVIISPVLSSNCVQIPRSKTRHQTSESQTGGPVMSIIEEDSHWNFKTLEAQLNWLSPPGLLRQHHHLSWQSWSVL